MQSRNFQFDMNPVHFKILSTRKLKHEYVFTGGLKTLSFQNYKLELTTRIQTRIAHAFFLSKLLLKILFNFFKKMIKTK